MPTLPRYESKGELTTQSPSQMSRPTLAGKDSEALATGATQVQGGVEKWNRAMDSMRSTQAEYNLKTSLMDIEQRMELDPDKNNSKKYLQEVDDAYNKSGAADTKSKLELDLVRQAMNYKVIGTFKNKQIDSDRANTAEMIALEVANPTPYSETYIQDLLAEKT